MRVLISGSRNWTDPWAIVSALRTWVPVGSTVIHGAHWEGADALADKVAKRMGGYNVKPHPADWKRLGRRAGPIRNREMINTNPDLVIAFLQQRKSSGTQHVISMARNRRIDYEVVSAEGEHESARFGK